jgi:putative MATE family efflux protein
MQQKSTQKPDLLTSPIVPTLRKMTIPMVFGMITLMLFNLVDTFFVSMLGTQELAAISFTFPVTFTVISLAIGLSIGTSAVIAKALGANDLNEARFDGAVALVVSAALVVLLSFIGYLLITPIFTKLGAKPHLLLHIHDYMAVWFMGSVLLITPMIGNAVLRASGDTKTPSIIMGGSGVINAILDPIFIFGFGPVPAFGIKGAAIASVIAWSFAVGYILYLLAVKRQLISFTKCQQSFASAARKMLKIGIPAAGANMLTPIAMAVMTAIVARYGEASVAAFGVGSRIESIASLVVLALSMTLPPFVSQNFGANKYDRVESAYLAAIKFVLAWQFAVYLLLVLLSGWVSHIFAKEEAVASVIQLFIYIMPLGYGLQGIIILTNSSFNALHKPMNALVLSVVRLFVFYVPFAYVGSLIGGLNGLFIGALIGNMVTACVAYNWFRKQLSQLAEGSMKGEVVNG